MKKSRITAGAVAHVLLLSCLTNNNGVRTAALSVHPFATTRPTIRGYGRSSGRSRRQRTVLYGTELSTSSRPDRQKQHETITSHLRNKKKCRSLYDVRKILHRGGTLRELDEIGVLPANLAATALRRMVDIYASARQDKDRTTLDISIWEALSPVLLRRAAGPVMAEDKNEDRDELNSYGVSNLFYSLGRLVEIRRKGRCEGDRSVSVDDASIPFLTKRLFEYVKGHNLKKLPVQIGKKRLMETLWSFSILIENNREECKDYGPLLTSIGNRITEGDYMSQLSAKELAHGLWVFASLEEPHLEVMKRFMRRLRKQSVRLHPDTTGGDLSLAIRAAVKLLGCMERKKARGRTGSASSSRASDLLAEYRRETQIMCHTLTQTLIERPDNGAPLLQTMFANNVADVLTAHASLYPSSKSNVPSQEETRPPTILVDFLDVLSSSSSNFTRSTDLKQMKRILIACDNLSLHHPSLLQTMGRKFSTLVNHDNRMGETTVLDVCTILQFVANSPGGPPHQSLPMEYFQPAARYLLHDSRTPFLLQCDSHQVSDLANYFAKGQWCARHPLRGDDIDDDPTLRPLIALAERMLHPSVLPACSPDAASRMLLSYTTLCHSFLSGDDATREMDPVVQRRHQLLRETQLSLFQNLCGRLLSRQTTINNAFRVMYAMAKMPYSLDCLGVFDFLADVLSAGLGGGRADVTGKSEQRELSLQQISLALWSCGKMMSWEEQPMSGAQNDSQSVSLVTSPPYLPAAKVMAQYLVTGRDRLTPKDIAQSMWALGRLGIIDEEIILPLSDSAIDMADRCNSQEIANILWGWSRIMTLYQPDQRHRIHATTQTLFATYSKILLSPSHLTIEPREASTILLACGRMNFASEELFESLSRVFAVRVQDTSAQSIANALWAYEQVGLVAPRGLLDGWMGGKLGIETVDRFHLREGVYQYIDSN